MQHRRKKKLPTLLVLVVLLLAGGVGFLMMWDIPAPQERIEKPLEAERFLKQS